MPSKVEVRYLKGNMAAEFWPQSSVPNLKGCGWGPNPSPGNTTISKF